MPRYWRVTYKLCGALLVTIAILVPVFLIGIVVAARPRLRVRVGAHANHLWSRIVVSIFRVRIQRIGALPPAGTMVVANHLSYLDILCLSSCYSGLFLSKAEISRWPGIGFLARTAGTLFINREQARDTDRMSSRLAVWLRAGERVTWFPEATTSRGVSIAPFKSALFQAAVLARSPCVPTTLGVTTPGTEAAPSQTVCWWDGTSLPVHFLRFLSLPRVGYTIHFGEPIRPTTDRKALSRDVYERVLAVFTPVRQGTAAAGHDGEPLRTAADRN